MPRDARIGSAQVSCGLSEKPGARKLVMSPRVALLSAASEASRSRANASRPRCCRSWCM